MDIKKIAAQVLLTAVDGRYIVPERTRRLLTEVPAGGIILFSNNIGPDTERTGRFINALSRNIANVSIHPFIAADQEGGRVQRFRGKAALPPPLSYWNRITESTRKTRNLRSNQARDIENSILLAIEQDAAFAARELRRMGVTMNLAPVAEVLTAKNRAFLDTRAYSSDPVFVVNAASAFIRGMNSATIAATLKHFPGNSSVDPHHNRSVLNVSKAELADKVKPFAELIRSANPAVVMLSHVIVPAWDTKPCTLSPAAVKQLRGLGYNGIIMADDFIMAAVGLPVEICTVQSLAAGVDMVIAWQKDLAKVHKAILTALEKGELSEKRLREAAERIIYQKIRYGIILP